MSEIPLIIIAGPTASGKTQAAIETATRLRQFNIAAEIINADSIQVYGDLKTLTAFPTEEETKVVPHHLFGFLSAEEKISVANWRELAETEIDKLIADGKVPILCGGTGFYIESVLRGISEIPSVSADCRAETREKFDQLGREAFFEELRHLDPEICKQLHPNNTQRILRAYEVATYTGKPLTYWWNQHAVSKYKNVISVVILPPRSVLLERIEKRTEQMLKTSAIRETVDFLQTHPLYDGALNAVIGFSEIRSIFERKENPTSEFSSDEISELQKAIVIRTRQYAKRQSTWFRNRMSDAEFVTTAAEAPIKICSKITV